MIELKYRTFWRRFCAGLIDGLTFYPFVKANEIIWGHHSSLPLAVIILWYIIISFLFEAYIIYMHGKYGQTLGKMAMKVKVCDVTESPLSMYQAFLREIIPICLVIISLILDMPKILSGVNIMDPNTAQYDIAIIFSVASTFGWFMIEIITMLFSRKRRALHDFIAGSVVIKLTPTSR